MNEYKNIAAPFSIGKVKIKNRLLMAPMDTGFGNLPNGIFTSAGIEYFVRRAQGGFGLLFSGGTNVDGPVDGTPCILDDPRQFVLAGKNINERLRAYGCKMFMQLTMNIGRNAGMKSPSPLPALRNPSVTVPELTAAEIHTKVEEMAQAAKLVREAGYAGIDIHALHWGHLLDSFALAFMNHRQDEYGGSLENRLRLCREIAEAIKKACGRDFPVTMRIALKSYMKDFDKASFTGEEEVGRTLEEAIAIAKLLESYGYDALSTDVGTLDAFYHAMPPSYIPMGSSLDLAAEVKKAVKIPILCGSRFADPDLIEQALAEGRVDAAVVGRQAIADPDFANKVLTGHPENVRTCIGCNQGCIWGYFTRGRVSCAVNPEVGREGQNLIAPALEKKNVAVVGGGLSGMEAARIAALRGHKVTLYEKSSALGGNLIAAGAHDFKREVAQLNEYFKQQMRLLPIDVKMNTEASAKAVSELKADAVILAVGSVPIMPASIPGIDLPKTLSSIEACLNSKPVGNSVVVVGGGLVGCELAYGYAKEGKEVTIVEALEDILLVNDVPEMNKIMLQDAFEHYGTRVLTQTRLQEITPEGAVVLKADGSRENIPADTVVMAIGYRPLPSMAEQLAGCGAAVYEIGDGNRVGNVLTCIQDAYEVAAHL
ncbi:MAG: FAD-dependent oxidoreductase [bacterium]|nr:FAD-dependent oxidoreductase [bacterium]